jgi:hypothetical protein
VRDRSLGTRKLQNAKSPWMRTSVLQTRGFIAKI